MMAGQISLDALMVDRGKSLAVNGIVLLVITWVGLDLILAGAGVRYRPHTPSDEPDQLGQNAIVQLPMSAPEEKSEGDGEVAQDKQPTVFARTVQRTFRVGKEIGRTVGRTLMMAADPVGIAPPEVFLLKLVLLILVIAISFRGFRYSLEYKSKNRKWFRPAVNYVRATVRWLCDGRSLALCVLIGASLLLVTRLIAPLPRVPETPMVISGRLIESTKCELHNRGELLTDVQISVARPRTGATKRFLRVEDWRPDHIVTCGPMQDWSFEPGDVVLISAPGYGPGVIAFVE